MREVEFTKDFGIKKKGEKATYDSMLSSHLVHVDKVAKYVTKSKPKEKAPKSKA